MRNCLICKKEYRTNHPERQTKYCSRICSGFGKKGVKKQPMSTEHKKKLSEHALRTGRKISFAGRKHTLESKKKMSEAQKGSKSKKWKGGITHPNILARSSFEYRLWRTAVFQRDHYQCIWGGKSHGSKLEADHIKPFAYFPELRFAIDNGRTLCKECHSKTDTYKRKALNFKQ